MGIEVANLLARIQMVAEGTPDVIRQAEAIREKLTQMGDSGAAAAQKLSEEQIKAAVALGRYEAAVRKAAEAEVKLAEAEARTGVNAEQAAVKVAELSAEIDKLNATVKAGGTVSAADIARIKVLETERKAFESVTKAAGEVATTKHRVLSAGERLVVSNRRLQDTTTETGKRFRFLTTELTGLISAMRTGDVGSTLLARALLRLQEASRLSGSAFASLKVSIFALIGAAALFAAGMAVVRRALTAANDAIKLSNLPELSDQLTDIADRAGVASNALRDVANDTTNIFRSLDITNAEEATDVVARLAEQLRALSGDSFEDVFRSLTQGIASGNLEGVARQFGLSASRLEAAIGDTTDLSKTEVAIRAINALLVETERNSDRITEAQSRQLTGWDQVKAAVEGFWEAVGEGAADDLSELAESAEEIVDAIKPLAGPLGKAVGDWIGGIAVLLKVAAQQAKPLLDLFTLMDELDLSLAHLGFGGALGGLGLLADHLGTTEGNAKSARKALDEFEAEVDTLPNSVRTLDDVIKEFYTDIGNTENIVDSIKSLAVAWGDMEADLTPGTAINAFNQLDKVIEMVVTNGVESIELLKLRAQALGRVGFATPEQVAAAQRGYDAIQRALTPIAEEAENVRQRLAQDVTSGFNSTNAAADLATGKVLTYISALNSIPRQVSTDVITNFVSVGSGGFSGGAPRVVPRGPSGFASHSITSTGFTRPTAPPRPAGLTAAQRASEEDRRVSVASQTASAQAIRNSQNFSDDLAAIRDLFDLNKAAGGGGGGAKKAADDFAATLEQIRALISAVNQAVMIGINGGVRIGTQGNVVPMLPGSFLNASGNQIAVEQIVIRGVWDFTDPATRRQIVKELESALQELKNEL